MSLNALTIQEDPAIASSASRAIKAIQELPESLRAGLGPDSSVEDCLQGLTSQRSSVPNQDPRLEAAIIPLVEIQRAMFAGGPYDIASEPAPPSPAGQGLLLDLKENNLKMEVADLLGVDYLSKAVKLETPTAEVEGILWGPGRRPLVSLPAQLRDGPTINVFMLVDTGAPVTELSISVFDALGCNSVPMAASINLGGYKAQVRLCDQGEHSNHRDIPILGADFLSKNRCVLEVDYRAEKVVIRFQ